MRFVGQGRRDRPDIDFVHALQGPVATDREGRPSCLAPILKDVSGQFGVEDRFEKTFNANPAPSQTALARTGYVHGLDTCPSPREPGEVDCLISAEQVAIADEASVRVRFPNPASMEEGILPVYPYHCLPAVLIHLSVRTRQCRVGRA